ncbi:2-oxoacid:acceptor oxidoreductase family protein, partial [bacterium]|nr:2-oxoacid:acceptor oxidoreductase family protein [bacterium]
MREIDLTIEIAGSSGDGTLASGDILSSALSDMGFNILSFDEYPAEIRGFGKCVAHIRVSDKSVMSVGRNVDILISLNDPYGIEQIGNLNPRGIVIFDSKPLKDLEEHECIAGHLGPGMFLYGVPFGELSQRATQSSRSRNLVSLGVIAALFDIDKEIFLKSLNKKFKKKKDLVKTVEASFLAGFDFVKESIIKIDRLTFAVSHKLEKRDFKILTGTQAVAQGAIDANCRFYAGYPITPATKIMEILSSRLPALGGSVVQTEDEISAIGMVTGAAFVGT